MLAVGWDSVPEVAELCGEGGSRSDRPGGDPVVLLGEGIDGGQHVDLVLTGFELDDDRRSSDELSVDLDLALVVDLSVAHGAQHGHLDHLVAALEVRLDGGATPESEEVRIEVGLLHLEVVRRDDGHLVVTEPQAGLERGLADGLVVDQDLGALDSLAIDQSRHGGGAQEVPDATYDDGDDDDGADGVDDDASNGLHSFCSPCCAHYMGDC